MVKEMLEVLMDGIKDANMLLDYAADAKVHNDSSYDWFKTHAKTRVDTVIDDYAKINNMIGLEQKAMAGDAIAESLKCYLKDQIIELKNAMASM